MPAALLPRPTECGSNANAEHGREPVDECRDLTIAPTRAIPSVWVGLAPATSGGWPAGIVSSHCAYSVYMATYRV